MVNSEAYPWISKEMLTMLQEHIEGIPKETLQHADTLSIVTAGV
jgi:hypothetical protein